MSADQSNTDANADSGEGKGNDEVAPRTFANVIESLSESDRAVVDDHFSTETKGLKNALESKKGTADTLKKQLSELKGAKDGEHAALIEGIETKLAAAEQDSAFFKSVSTLNLTNPPAALILARASGTLRKDGSLDVERFQKTNPEQFGTLKPPPRADAGAGANGKQATSGTVDDFIRGIGRR